jgi:hypothetical protein
LENSDDDADINRVWETITENIKFSAQEGQSYYELKQHKSWFVETFSNKYIKDNKPNCNGYRI